MLKLINSVIIVLSFVSSFANASLIESSLDDAGYQTFISYGGYDWTWASAHNVQFYGRDCENSSSFKDVNVDWTEADPIDPNKQYIKDDQDFCNQLLGASFHQGWSFYEDTNMNLSLNDSLIAIYENRFGTFNANESMLMSIFSDEDNTLVSSFDYWNTADVVINEDALYNAASKWDLGSWAFPGQSTPHPNIFTSTIYVRQSADIDDHTPVPEPSTLMIFALSLIGIAARRKVKA